MALCEFGSAAVANSKSHRLARPRYMRSGVRLHLIELQGETEMPKQMGREHVDLKESSVWGPESGDAADNDAMEADLDRLESVTGGADDPVIAEGELGEEIDALEVNLFQDDELSNARDGSGIIVDDVAEERIGKLTETGPWEDAQGTASVSPGRDDTSSTLRRHHSNTEVSRTEDIVEGNMDEPRDEIKSDAMADEGTGA
jgi:hypothetical protein